MKKGKILALALSVLLTASTATTAFAAEKSNILTSKQKEIEFRIEKNKEFEELFPEEMKQLKELQKSASFSSRTKTDEELMDEIKDTEPVIDSEKNIDGDYYRLTAYSNGCYTQIGISGGEIEDNNKVITRASTGITGGTTQSGSGYFNRNNATAYCNFFNNSVQNTLQGHTIGVTISYSLVNGAYDNISSYSLKTTTYCNNITKTTAKLKEDASGKATIKYKYSGRTSNSPSGAIYNNLTFAIYVGKDEASAQLIY